MRPMTLLACLLASLPLAAGCGRGGDTREITGRRAAPAAPAIPPMAPFDDATRFGFDRAGPGAAREKPRLVGDLPPGWTSVPAGQDRDAAFRVEGSPDVDVSLTVLAGNAGGLAANVNRWRSQLGLSPVSEEEVAGLPAVDLLGGRGVQVTLDGAYRGMGGEAREGWRLTGIVAPIGSFTLFLKMTGPSGAVAAQEPAFLELARSLRPESTGGPAMPADDGAGRQADLSRLAWTVPEGWEEVPGARSPRVATFRPAGRADVDVSLVVLGGTGGGLTANLNRWRAQVGLPDLGPGELAALPRVDVLGRPCALLAAEGAYAGMSEGPGVAGSMLLGVAVVMPQASVFVKMTGPAAAVKAERERFVALCVSLR